MAVGSPSVGKCHTYFAWAFVGNSARQAGLDHALTNSPCSSFPQENNGYRWTGTRQDIVST
jgi:hypothetical protein